MTDHPCNYSVPIEGTHARLCEVCGQPQVYRAPTGSQSAKIPVIVDRDDLRQLIEGYRGQAAMTDEGMEALCDRLELLLD